MMIKEKMTMERTAIQSSNIISVGYEPESSTLEIEFKNGIYQYFGVPQNAFEDLVNAGSKGTYFSQSIKNVYPCSKVS